VPALVPSCKRAAACEPVADEPVPCMVGPRSSDIDRFLGHRIKQLRLGAGMTQQQVARRLGVSSQQVHKYEKGISRFSAERLLAIARVFDVAVADLFEAYSGAPTDRIGDPETSRLLLDLTCSFLELEPKHQDAFVRLVRALAAED
jgi:transcriptional regulator with XRE-family HTH domain